MDLKQIIKIDLFTGAVNVCGVLMKPLKGFNIGSPLAAGASALYASWKEYEFLNKLGSFTKRVLQESALLMRWMDDVVHIWRRKKVRGPAWQAIKKLQERGFYGKELELLKEGGSTAAFGFQVRIDGGVLEVESEMRFLRRQEGGKFEDCPKMQSGKQFAPRKTMIATATGRLCRVLDTTNAKQEEVEMMLLRVISAMRSAGFEKMVLRRAITSIEGKGWGTFRVLNTFVEEPKRKLVQFTDAYDRLRIGAMKYNEALMDKRR